MNGFQGIRDFMREMVESGKISGCAAAVYRRGECLFREFVGYGDAKNTLTAIYGWKPGAALPVSGIND